MQCQILFIVKNYNKWSDKGCQPAETSYDVNLLLVIIKIKPTD